MDDNDVMDYFGIPSQQQDTQDTMTEDGCELQLKMHLETPPINSQNNYQMVMSNVEPELPQQIFQSPAKEDTIQMLKSQLQKVHAQIAMLNKQVESHKQMVSVYEEMHKKDQEVHTVNASLIEAQDKKIKELENQLAEPCSPSKEKDFNKKPYRALVTLAEKLKENGLLSLHYQKRLIEWKQKIQENALDSSCELVSDENRVDVVDATPEVDLEKNGAGGAKSNLGTGSENNIAASISNLPSADEDNEYIDVVTVAPHAPEVQNLANNTDVTPIFADSTGCCAIESNVVVAGDKSMTPDTHSSEGDGCTSNEQREADLHTSSDSFSAALSMEEEERFGQQRNDEVRPVETDGKASEDENMEPSLNESDKLNDSFIFHSRSGSEGEDSNMQVDESHKSSLPANLVEEGIEQECPTANGESCGSEVPIEQEAIVAANVQETEPFADNLDTLTEAVEAEVEQLPCVPEGADDEHTPAFDEVQPAPKKKRNYKRRPRSSIKRNPRKAKAPKAAAKDTVPVEEPSDMLKDPSSISDQGELETENSLLEQIDVPSSHGIESETELIELSDRKRKEEGPKVGVTPLAVEKDTIVAPEDKGDVCEELQPASKTKCHPNSPDGSEEAFSLTIESSPPLSCAAVIGDEDMAAESTPDSHSNKGSPNDQRDSSIDSFSLLSCIEDIEVSDKEEMVSAQRRDKEILFGQSEKTDEASKEENVEASLNESNKLKDSFHSRSSSGENSVLHMEESGLGSLHANPDVEGGKEKKSLAETQEFSKPGDGEEVPITQEANSAASVQETVPQTDNLGVLEKLTEDETEAQSRAPEESPSNDDEVMHVRDEKVQTASKKKRSWFSNKRKSRKGKAPKVVIHESVKSLDTIDDPPATSDLEEPNLLLKSSVVPSGSEADPNKLPLTPDVAKGHETFAPVDCLGKMPVAEERNFPAGSCQDTDNCEVQAGAPEELLEQHLEGLPEDHDVCEEVRPAPKKRRHCRSLVSCWLTSKRKSRKRSVQKIESRERVQASDIIEEPPTNIDQEIAPRELPKDLPGESTAANPGEQAQAPSENPADNDVHEGVPEKSSEKDVEYASEEKGFDAEMQPTPKRGRSMRQASMKRKPRKSSTPKKVVTESTEEPYVSDDQEALVDQDQQQEEHTDAQMSEPEEEKLAEEISRKRGRKPASSTPKKMRNKLEAVTEALVDQNQEKYLQEENMEAQISEPEEQELAEEKSREQECKLSSSIPKKRRSKRKAVTEMETRPRKQTFSPGTLIASWTYSPGVDDCSLALFKAKLPHVTRPVKIYAVLSDDEDSTSKKGSQALLKSVKWADKNQGTSTDAAMTVDSDIEEEFHGFPNAENNQETPAPADSTVAKPTRKKQLKKGTSASKTKKLSKIEKLKGKFSKSCPLLQPKFH